MTRALGNLYDHNFFTDFMDDSPFGQGHVYRAYVRPTDAGLKMMTWPATTGPRTRRTTTTRCGPAGVQRRGGDDPAAGCSTRGCGSSVPSTTATTGSCAPTSSAGPAAPRTAGGNPFGDDECGKWYSRAMSNWSVLLALQGFSYDAAAQSIGFAPQWQPDDHRTFFTAGNSWGTFTQHARRRLDADAHHRRPVRRARLRQGRPRRDRADRVEVRVEGERLDGAAAERDGDELAVAPAGGDRPRRRADAHHARGGTAGRPAVRHHVRRHLGRDCS
jgi:hypothetical protein